MHVVMQCDDHGYANDATTSLVPFLEWRTNSNDDSDYKYDQGATSPQVSRRVADAFARLKSAAMIQRSLCENRPGSVDGQEVRYLALERAPSAATYPRSKPSDSRLEHIKARLKARHPPQSPVYLLLPPTSHLLPPTSYLLPPTSYLLSPTSYFLPPISYLLTYLP